MYTFNQHCVKYLLNWLQGENSFISHSGKFSHANSPQI